MIVSQLETTKGFEHLHLGFYKYAVKYMMKGLGLMSDKLKNFPSVNVVTLKDSVDRQNLLRTKFNEYGIDNFTFHYFDRYRDEDHKILLSADINSCVDNHYRGPTTSHLKAIKKWYESTEEEYTMFFEDDISFDSIKYWDFTWDEFFENLPDHWECVQLCLVCEFPSRMQEVLNRNSVSNRDWDDWSCCAYLIKRSHAKKLIDMYYPEEIFYLDYKGWDRELRSNLHDYFLTPTSETIIYTLFSGTKEKQTILAFHLFLENIEFNTTWEYSGSYIDNPESSHYFSRNLTLDWWKTNGPNLSIDKICMNI